MNRSRKTIPPYIRNLAPSISKPGLFDITWEGITYTMPLALAMKLAEYFKDVRNKEVSVSHWRQQLPAAEQQQVLIN
ncbi:hypothetical protein SAMN05421788_106172 [Filimonas lacunae]|uniref:Uncharacterized protein n=1 Tax=Filimonas lacunae TaxID=477680 RepID=A0A173MFA8_9BACT|nr:hypothetical protein [Filimonas lacunae]BAV06111.1 hypothetical protein FLA_2126 [Filimonas lacunae]SIT24692.1 hypothetical protein SAMN05421788_106172 [Filimonas lacunae]